MLNIDLSDQNILISGGAGSGVASGIVESLHRSGAKIIVLDNRQDALDTVCKAYPKVTPFHVDISNQEAIQNVFKDISERIGALHGLINNAGVGLSKPAHQTSEIEFEKLFAINIQAAWRLSRIFVQQCIKHTVKGNIVNISSVHAHSTSDRYAIYSSSKNAIIGLTRGMAVELGPLGMRVNAVGPGYVHAEQNYDLIRTWTDDPNKWVQDFFKNQQVLNFEIKPIDIGHTVAFLLSDLAQCITGQNIYIDNGTTSLIFNRDFT